jgi:mRNA degradation ribonuclease J1/J2
LRHAELARELRVPEVAVLEDGDLATLDSDGLRKSGRIASGRVHVMAGRVLPSQVIAERTALAAQGAVHVAVPLDTEGRLAGDIAVATRGVLDEGADAELLEAARREAYAAIEELMTQLQGGAGAGVSPQHQGSGASPPIQGSAEERISETVRLAVRRSLAKKLGFKPVTTASLVRVHR